MSTTSPANHYWRSDITGLRAVAVLPVLFFHAFPKLLPGGFFGVDVFFVISGYLISGIIFRGLADGTFSYREFYAKRIRRIIPNLVLVLAFVAALGYFCLLPEEYKNLGQHIRSSAAFVQNFRLLSEIGYFTEDALRKPLLHLWSLAIEEQFYIVFPLLLSLAWWLFRTKTAIGVIVLLIVVCSLEACFMTTDKSFAFYFPLTRFWELGAGILLAYAESFGLLDCRRLARGFRHGMSMVGLLCLLVPMAVYSNHWAHPGWITLAPVAGAVMLIAASPDAAVNRTLLSWRPMTFVGLISYSLYLWHWPLLSFLFIGAAHAPAQFKMAALAASFVIATAVYFFVENPVRRSRCIGRVPTVAILLVLLMVAFAGGRYIRTHQGLPSRALNFDNVDVSHVREPNEWTAHDKGKRHHYVGFEVPMTLDADLPPVVLISGDSHAAQYFQRARVLSERRGRQTAFFASMHHLFKQNYDRVAGGLFRALEDKNVKVVVLAHKWSSSTDPFWSNYFSEVKEHLARRKDLRVFVILDPPFEEVEGRQGETDPLRHVNRLSIANGASNYTLSIGSLPKVWKEGNLWVQKFFGDSVTYLDPTPEVWRNGKCNVLYWYKDDDHLQPNRLEADGVWLDKAYE